MAKYIPKNFGGDLAPLNPEFEKLAQAIDKTLSRVGDTPNAVTATIDMNGQRLINLPAPIGANEPARLKDVQSVAQTLPDQTGNNNKYLKTDGNVATWQDAVNSFKGRVGEVQPQTGDYTANQIVSVNGYVQADLNSLGSRIESIETTYNNSQWDAAYSWGNHALAGYALQADLQVESNRLDALTVATVAEAKALDVLVGTVVETQGYNSSGDGGANRYVVVAGGTGTDDGGSFIDMDNGLQLKALFLSGANINQWGAKPEPGFDNLSFIQNAFNWVTSKKGKVTIKRGRYGISRGVYVFAGTIEHEEGAVIVNTNNAGNSAEFWTNTAVFFGTYFGYNSPQGVNAEPNYNIQPMLKGDRTVSFLNAADANAFSVGDPVFIRSSETYSNPLFYKGSHVSRVKSIGTGFLELRDAVCIDINTDGVSSPVVIRPTETLQNTRNGIPLEVKLADGLNVINGQYESLALNNSQVVHISGIDCSFDFDFCKGGICFGINPLGHSKIDCRDAQFYRRGFELAYFHQNIVSDLIKVKRIGVPINKSVGSVAFSCSEYGNSKFFKDIFIEDYPAGMDAPLPSAWLLTPQNHVSGVLEVNGSSDNSAVSFSTRRAVDSSVNFLNIVRTHGDGLDVFSNNVTISKLDVKRVPVNKRAAVIGQGVSGSKILSGVLGEGSGSGTRFSILDESGDNSNNVVENVLNHFSKVDERVTGVISKQGNGSLVTDQEYILNAKETTKTATFTINAFGNIPLSSTNGPKSIMVDIGGVLIELNATASETGYFRIRAELQKSKSNNAANVYGTIEMQGSATTQLFDFIGTNLLYNDLSISLKYNLVSGDSFNLRDWSVNSFNDQKDIA